MILNPKPKPIRYRISSGGVEHSSLDSLRRHFRWNEVKELIQEERIQEWLRKINKDSVAVSIENAQKEDAPEWSVAAIFFGLEGLTLDGWLPLVKYWSDQGLEETISLNKDQWANNDLELEQLKRLRLPVPLIEEMADYQYDHLPPEKTKKTLKRIADMGSVRAGQKLKELQEEERIEAARKEEEAARERERKKQEAQRKAQEKAIEDAKKSKEALRDHWRKKNNLKRFQFDSSLGVLVRFLCNLQELLALTKDENSLDYQKLAKCIDNLEKDAVWANSYKEYYLCSIIATYRFLPHGVPDKVVNLIQFVTPEGISASIKKYRPSSIVVHFRNSITDIYLWKALSLFDNKIANRRNDYQLCYSIYDDYIHGLGLSFLNQY